MAFFACLPFLAVFHRDGDISIFLNIEHDTIFYFIYRYTFDISHQLSVITCCIDHSSSLSSIYSEILISSSLIVIRVFGT